MAEGQTFDPTGLRPYPELVAGSSYDIREIGPANERRADAPISTNVCRKIMQVYEDVEGWREHRHELGHIRWSPGRIRNTPDHFWVRCVEEARVNLGLEALEMARLQREYLLPERAKSVAPALIELAQSDAPDGDVVAVGLTLLFTEMEEAALALLATRPAALLELRGVKSELQRRTQVPFDVVPTFDCVKQIAARLFETYGATSEMPVDGHTELPCICAAYVASKTAPPSRPPPPGGMGGSGGGSGGSGGGGGGGSSPSSMDNKPPPPKVQEIIKQIQEMPRHDGGKPQRGDNAPWGQMRTFEPPLSQPQRSKSGRAARMVRSGVDGSVFRSPHRLYVDGGCFRKKLRRGFGGSVLIDASGSMSISNDQIDRIVAIAPGHMTVAMYCGSSTWGELVVLAKNGRRASPEYIDRRCGGGNIVDVPALAWLAKQRGPRIWVSDGLVTGMGDVQSPMVQEASFAIVKASQIRRVGSAEDGYRYLDKMRREHQAAEDDARRRGRL